MKQKFIEWFTKNNNGCSPAMEDDRSFVYEMTQHMFEAYQAGVAEGEARCAALAAEAHGFKRFFIFAINAAFDGCDITGYQIQEVAKEIGLVRVESYSAEKHAEMSGDPSVMEEGDDFYIMNKTPATDAFLAEVRAAAVDEVCLKISNAIVNCYQDEQVGLDAAATICGDFAAQLRKGVQS
ncbi:hypothetical protein VBL71_04720 [Enterobacter hormaechei]|uniref:hypothetical protein n=1 Tax=Enterobacter cloacae complex TaxID=354276 RepID=UPI000799238C|nr:hypothetical protein [Enterobacter hormaechei]MEA3634674.1 hypothetical protein [Enterobacter hormaechei]CZV67855.1 Uncharacterised protein [Enterobacter hormaechei]